jgi:SAM-dependent methyltransferase
MKEMIKRIPIVGSISRKIYGALCKKKPFPGSEEYWIQRYKSGGNSGPGSFHKLAEFKSEIINDFVKRNNVVTVIEYGCGDGYQLKLAEYPSYIGFDVSPKAITLCQDIFQDDKTKSFRLMTEYKGETAQLTLSIDVIYHLIEDDIYYSYMERLFNSSERFVIIYSSNYDEEQQYHEKRRQFTRWVETNISIWKLTHHIPNRFPYNGNNKEGSLSDFYIYEKL